MYKIQTNGYSTKEKIQIAKNYLLPKIQKDVKIDEEIIFQDDIIKHIIDHFTGDEKGVRNLKRCLEVIYRKINLYHLMSPGTKLFDDNSSLKVEFPLTISRELVEKLIKKSDEDNSVHLSLYM